MLVSQTNVVINIAKFRYRPAVFPCCTNFQSLYVPTVVGIHRIYIEKDLFSEKISAKYVYIFEKK